MIRRSALRLILVTIAALALPRAAAAYPQWQFSSGTSRCNQCHFAPGGGGLITGYGRDASGEELSTWEGSGDFAHGLIELPSWLALGFDGRGAVISHDAGNPEGPLNAFFPMQADLLGRFVLSKGLSLSATAGYRGQARKGLAPGPSGFQPAGGSLFISREHYLMWRAEALGPYVRAGRFFAPYGLRLAEHFTYVRRDLGFNLLEETYGLSVGVVKNGWELHATAFAPDFLRGIGGRDKGAAVMFEKRMADALALGLQTRVGLGTDMNRFAGGVFGKAWVEKVKTQLAAEVDVVHKTFSGTAAEDQMVAYLGATLFPVRGLWLSAYVERTQTSIKVADSATDAVTGQLNWFPYPHFELLLVGRLQQPKGEEAARTILTVLHYYL